MVTKGQGVAHEVAPGPDVHRSATQARDIVDRGLEGPLVAAAQVALLDANADLSPPDLARRGRCDGRRHRHAQDRRGDH